MININAKNIKKKKMLDMLIKSKKAITVNDIAKKINISEKTVRTYLKELKKDFNNSGCNIVVKQKVGVEIKYDSIESISNLEKIFEIGNNNLSQRCQYILKILLENRFTYTTQLFAEELYCNKTTINNDLKLIEKWLTNKNIKLIKKQNRGISIEGLEENIRKALIQLYKMLEPSNNIYNENLSNSLDYRLDYITYIKLQKIFDKINLIEIQNIVKDAEIQLGYCFTKEGFINIIIHISVAVYRLKQKNNIAIPIITYNTIKDTKEFKVAEDILIKLSYMFNIKISLDEITYIALHICGTKIQISDTLDTGLTKNDYHLNIAKKITKLVGDILEEDISNDSTLINSLALHLKPTIIRLTNGINIDNPLLEKIKVQLRSIFSATWACSSIFQDELGIMITEDEVAYLTLHIASALKKIKKKTKVLLICSNGIGSSQFLATKIENEFDNIEIIKTIPYNHLSKDLVSSCDFIVSTMCTNINTFGKKCINVTAMLDEDDKIRIFNTVCNLNKKCHINKYKSNIQHIIDENLLFDCLESLSFKEIIIKYGQVLLDKGYANKGFIENVIARENISSTNIGKGIAIPHSEEQYVNKSKVCIVRLNTPIILGSSSVDLLFILCLKFSDVKIAKKLFKGFYQIINDDDIVHQIKTVKNKNKIKNLFVNGGR